ncbi:hypothetical protein [Kutzneria kofuensis]|uniref:Uncharacterized protein n=1 Tax=Kutzneria kofuensis TaxID=103725 RepID=A0A7W9KIT1_9PSEU|nr:hypothetical protein [Kutzneria kofuensis]MBB5892785.1 hypothetical protein [Kutzneria kofuensis]MBB5893185.1 hypothetical protein [Kutzneria kofuensis]
MLVLCREKDGKPMVAEVGWSQVPVTVTDVSEFHVTVRFGDGADQLNLVLARDVAARLVARLLPLMAKHVTWLVKRGEG